RPELNEYTVSVLNLSRNQFSTRPIDLPSFHVHGEQNVFMATHTSSDSVLGEREIAIIRILYFKLRKL
ncbi:MAG: hypothetical protein UU78_C0010G0001, partial [Candidatus Roizmanbacteria bacterium GW2011_GWC2_41_7]